MDGRTASSERSKAALLDAALSEFAERGLAGARVANIASRAGVNKQLISYHFGGKDGLYEALLTAWTVREQELRADSPALEELAGRYLEAALAEPRWTQLAVRTALDKQSGQMADTTDHGLLDIQARSLRGELADGLTPEAVLLAITGMVSAPALHGGAPTDYSEQLRIIVSKLTNAPISAS